MFMEGTDRQCRVARLVLYCVTVCIMVLVLSVLRTAVLCLWKEQTDSAVWHSKCAVLCDNVYIGIGVECVTYCSVVFMERTDRECSVAQLVCCVVSQCVYWYWCWVCYVE